jgi:hypothetical protein
VHRSKRESCSCTCVLVGRAEERVHGAAREIAARWARLSPATL